MTDWQPSASLAALKQRAGLYAMIRRFFSERAVIEVETPVLSRAGNPDPNIQSLTLTVNLPQMPSGRRWLRTSPEFALKRLVAAGLGDCFEMGRVFRDGEAGRRHNPEFTLLEWYRVGWDHRRLMEETADLVQAAMALSGRRTSVREISFRDLYRSTLGIDPFTDSDHALRAPLAVYAIDATGLGRDDWLDLLMTHLIQPALPSNRVLLVYDYPPSQCALARIRPDSPPVAERFELYLGPLEIANGYHELINPAEQRERFTANADVRQRRGERPIPIDQAFIAALDAGLPACAGVAVGVDRLLMAMLGTDNIHDVMAFAAERA
ncbi:MAG: EF-P lysine aminoacylase GenX [Lysobacterales bacterium CG17_big_fil_post_rev_8_21_14_2_50_64_11]|nr:MAG: EF-P lysine aminoacylase GenX [Xanthomonadales bacterium CG17_big_fil_post_rev_8_21_14_2_50_64_11]